MKNLIIYGTKCGSTEDCAKILQSKIPNTEIVNAKLAKSIKDLKSYDNIIIGSNVIIGKFNRYVRKFVKKNKAILNTKKVYGYVVASGAEYEQKYITNFSKLVNNKVLYVGGVFDASKAKGLAKKVITSIVEDMKKKNQPLPTIKKEKLDELAAFINENSQNI